MFGLHQRCNSVYLNEGTCIRNYLHICNLLKLYIVFSQFHSICFSININVASVSGFSDGLIYLFIHLEWSELKGAFAKPLYSHLSRPRSTHMKKKYASVYVSIVKYTCSPCIICMMPCWRHSIQTLLHQISKIIDF